MTAQTTKSPFDIPNIRSFIAFRIFFSARFYYPVFTILFLDFGLTLEQFALLNVAWAVTIVLLEVPSGAMADVIGRRNLVVFAAVAMVIEIAVLCFAPRGNVNLLFGMFLFNRILSGASEAAASGADEALAYDSLKKDGDIKRWGTVLEKEMRYKSIAFIIAMSVGAAVYDPDSMNYFLHWIGLDLNLSQDVTIRFPLYLTLCMSVMALVSTLRMKEPPQENDLVCSDFKTCQNSVLQAFKLTIKAGKWILKTPFALMIIISAMVFDHIIRMIVTLESQYLRQIDLPEATFGLIWSGFSVLGIFIPRIALRFAENYSPAFNFGLTCIITLIGLFGMALFLPVFGLFPALVLFCAFYLIGFYVSYYLNQITDSSQRATVLSFKGLSLNGAYGLIGIFYSLLVAAHRSSLLESRPSLQGEALEGAVFIKTFMWFPWYFVVMVVLLLIFARWSLKGSPDVLQQSDGDEEKL